MGSTSRLPSTSSVGRSTPNILAGTDSSYIVDRFYGHPSSTISNDWRIVDTLQRVVPPEAGAQEYRTVFDDGYHPTPKGLTVDTTTLGPDGLSFILRAGDGLKAGYADNAIVEASLDPPDQPQDAKKKRQKQRVFLGVLPAIPFEIVQE